MANFLNLEVQGNLLKCRDEAYHIPVGALVSVLVRECQNEYCTAPDAIKKAFAHASEASHIVVGTSLTTFFGHDYQNPQYGYRAIARLDHVIADNYNNPPSQTIFDERDISRVRFTDIPCYNTYKWIHVDTSTHFVLYLIDQGRPQRVISEYGGSDSYGSRHTPAQQPSPVVGLFSHPSSPGSLLHHAHQQPNQGFNPYHSRNNANTAGSQHRSNHEQQQQSTPSHLHNSEFDILSFSHQNSELQREQQHPPPHVPTSAPDVFSLNSPKLDQFVPSAGQTWSPNDLNLFDSNFAPPDKNAASISPYNEPAHRHSPDPPVIDPASLDKHYAESAIADNSSCDQRSLPELPPAEDSVAARLNLILHRDHHIPLDTLRKAHFEKHTRGQHILAMVYNHRAMSKVLELLGVAKCGEVIPDTFAIINGQSMVANDLLKEFGWTAQLFQRKTVWYRIAEDAARKKKWKSMNTCKSSFPRLAPYCAPLKSSIQAMAVRFIKLGWLSIICGVMAA